MNQRLLRLTGIGGKLDQVLILGQGLFKFALGLVMRADRVVGVPHARVGGVGLDVGAQRGEHFFVALGNAVDAGDLEHSERGQVMVRVIPHQFLVRLERRGFLLCLAPALGELVERFRGKRIIGPTFDIGLEQLGGLGVVGLVQGAQVAVDIRELEGDVRFEIRFVGFEHLLDRKIRRPW